MLKKVHVSQIKLGMFIHRLEGDWLDHPFWKTRFVLKTERDLQKLRASVIQEIWIDPALGLDLEPDPETAAAAPLPEPKIPEQAADAVPVEQLPLDRPTAELDSEIGKASAIVRRAKQQLAELFAKAKEGDAPALEGAHALAGDVAESVMRHSSALVSLSRLKAQEDYVYLHSLAVSALMVALARQMGMDEERCRLAGLAGLLHNVGMAMVPAEIIKKKGELSDEETFVVRAHPVQGYEMLKSSADYPKEILEACLHHHERWDGAGYPFGLEAEAIPLFARMCTICDAYDAITSNRSYRSGWDPGESIAQMASWTGQFDQELFNAFVRSMGVFPTGSLVRLQSQKLAVVIDQNPHSQTTPVVKVFYSLRSQMHIPPERVDLGHPSCRDRIVSREPAAEWSKLGLDSLWAGSDVRRR
jgi:putative nucleotidyltransferase with HDIG domain